MSKKIYAPSMMRALRGRRGLEGDDESQDSEIMQMSPEEVVRQCALWSFGDPVWARYFARWIKESGADIDKLIEEW